MKKKWTLHVISVVAFVLFIALGLASGSSEPAVKSGYTLREQDEMTGNGVSEGGTAQSSATPLQQSTTTPQPSSQYWTGAGGRGMRLGILVPHNQGLNENQGYLPALIQGILVSNFSKYSAISVLDRVSLDRVITETLDLTYEDDLDIVSLGHVAQVGHMMTGSVIRTSTGFSLQINVTDTTAQATTVASYSGTCTPEEIDDHSAIHKASLELLNQMNVQLTSRARNELNKASSQETVSAQTALARGVTAQRQGTEVAALNYYLQAAELDPTLQEATTRLSIVTASITGGNIGAGVQNDMQWRNQWIARLRETEDFLTQYMRESPAFYLVYPSSSDQWGIEYERNTVILTIELCSLPDPLWFETINQLTRTIRSGLLATGRAEAWRLNWPAQTMKTPSIFADSGNNYPVVVEILNARGTSLGRQTVNLRFGWFIYNGLELTGHIMPYIQLGTKAAFPGIDANAVSGNLSMRITSINGRPAESSATQMGIRILLQNEYNNVHSIVENGLHLDNLRLFTIRFDGNRNLLRGFSGTSVNVSIPWGVTVIDRDSGLREKALMSVTMPSSLLDIGRDAFRQNRLTSVIIPDSVISIGSSAFYENLLTSVFIGDGVTSIGEYAFRGNNPIRSFTIGANIHLDGDPFSNDFRGAYRNNGNRAGTYTWDGNKWNYSALQ